MWDNYPEIKEELAAFEEYLAEKLSSRNEFLQTACRSAVLSGGKRLRPAFTIITAMSGNYRREVVFPAAASVEILHTATLIHDDIIDCAKTRRGQPTLAEKHSINLAVYTGDYLLAKSLRLLVETGLEPERLDVVARAVSMLCEGEVDQYLGKYEFASVHVYLKRIMRKTGILFSAASLLGAKAGDLDETSLKLFGRFGMSFGTAFQIKDDILDIESNERIEGKPVINDLKEGIVTLPVIYAVRNNPGLRGEIEEYFDGKKDVRQILKKVTSSGGQKDSHVLKKKYVERCKKYLSQLPVSIATRAMTEVIEWL